VSILVINAGSSSLKIGLFDNDARETLVSGGLDWAEGGRHRAALVLRTASGGEFRDCVAVADDRAAIQCVLGALSGPVCGGAEMVSSIQSVGHRIVHGGVEFRESVLIRREVKAGIARLSELAPLHNPPALAAIEAVEEALPGVPQAAVFDTTFYASLPPKAYIYALPYEWHLNWGIRRFGFHGISHAYCAQRAAKLLGRDLGELRIVSCHLGGGCSATAVQGGVAIATTLGFTTLDGLMMGTRSGAIDPGILTYLQRHKGMTLERIEQALMHNSGLLGVSGVSLDMSKIELAASQGNERARLAFDIFADQVQSAIAGLAVKMGGVDVLVFTDRIGENSPALRAAACEGLACLGLRLDHERNARRLPDIDIATSGSPGRILVIHTREEFMIAGETARVVGSYK
jgi:acetate kinase